LIGTNFSEQEKGGGKKKKKKKTGHLAKVRPGRLSRKKKEGR